MKILLVEDEIELALSIQKYFTNQGFHCEWAADFTSASDKITTYNYDCILLDLMLPDGDGMNILSRLRQLQKEDGVIVISAKETVETKVESLTTGADDYLTKPFHLSELYARVQALLRRRNFHGFDEVHLGKIEIKLEARQVFIENEAVELTKKEFDLLLYLIANKNRVLSKSTLAEHISGDMADMMDNHDFVYAHIKNLKKKLKDRGIKNCIKTVYGFGYQWTYEA